MGLRTVSYNLNHESNMAETNGNGYTPPTPHELNQDPDRVLFA